MFSSPSPKQSLIVLFRPLEIHVRISQVQSAKRAARRATALRRAEAERLLYEARQRKRMAALAKATELQGMGQKHAIQRSSLEPDTIGVNKFDVQTGLTAHSGPRQVNAIRVVSGQRGGRMGTVVTRNTRGGRVLQVNPAGANPAILPRPDAPRATSTGVGWLRNRSSSARGKRAPSRRVVVYRGSIMQRIIEEKRRQRTISVGSLDGMVITRDNELIAASLAPNLDRPLLSASAIHRISEAVARKIEVKMQNQLPEGSTVGASRAGLSRSQLRVSLPQVVQEYIQSQLSVALQQQQQQQHKQSTAAATPFYVSATQHPTALSTTPTNPMLPAAPANDTPSTGVSGSVLERCAVWNHFASCPFFTQSFVFTAHFCSTSEV
ncbi:unnamed protein product [Echinostoma caproni]|uniref:SKIP_SNW domain-containing protein n=1 Tax=Echinostoma caproni TaxID=27848 RepID=A0A183ASZ5_9TREM|nr:unnamed protein product [Echinostoma caproni]